jgi:hypothetical protein
VSAAAAAAAAAASVGFGGAGAGAAAGCATLTHMLRHCPMCCGGDSALHTHCPIAHAFPSHTLHASVGQVHFGGSLLSVPHCSTHEQHDQDILHCSQWSSCIYDLSPFEASTHASIDLTCPPPLLLSSQERLPAPQG